MKEKLESKAEPEAAVPGKKETDSTCLTFCPTCGNLLLLENVPPTGFRFYCQTCPYIHNIHEKLTRRVELKRKKVDDVLGGQEAWKNAQTTTTLCPKCNHTKAYYMQLQTRSADEPMTEFYRCANFECAHNWKEH
mmetsp:Transcript_18283/g.35780  ORF Transcript_18283/g.35780 Transcript_18283/m.35780 type:complete len:135 (+) Transcript_18283:1371-1775(+)